jgi:hypothetical protein
LGLIFKPKHGGTLRRRLGENLHERLVAAIKTGRCHLYDKTGLVGYTSEAPPMLAALSSDLCIHGHFGTAGMECALLGIPTLVIDREGTPFHKFYDLLPKDRVIFQDWNSVIEASRDFFNSVEGTTDFGDWSKVIRELDPFNDTKGALRMGSYLNNITKGFEKGLDREEVLSSAADQYSKEWGQDKVIVST